MEKSHRFGQAGADSSAWGLDSADESTPTNCTKTEAPVEAGRNDDQDLEKSLYYYSKGCAGNKTPIFPYDSKKLFRDNFSNLKN